ncbi:hypothetical protein D0T25_14335 [Duganella sp. BJB488]|uniref:hypothetical protein n=1 Tax=unclassified Duganella TaxID=2636909 RepID=UPI000E3537D3|nr:MULTISPECIES: hypothetical protein [unclassified Duganella]RFP20490.1 hypothetical protein D0T26_14645 [Duganella sp. BJB489]RFP21074.1 hypothetical protein D0T25_14335 [Duganella sp. BJB488]RFP33210.1 hypothetical protein D0T24_18030 [Duganella sp. BJB480]
MIAIFFKKRWQRLSKQSESKRLSLFTLILLFGLDIYILSLVFDGMNRAERIVEPPALPISAECQLMSEDFLKLDSKNQVENLERYIPKNETNQGEAMPDNWYGNTQALGICTKVHDQLTQVAKNGDFVTLFRARNQQQQKIEEFRARIDQLKATYGDALLEKLANQKRSDSILPIEATKIKKSLADLNDALNIMLQQQTQTQAALEHHQFLQAYVAFLRALPIDTEFTQARKQYDTLAFWYPLKELGAQAGFLLPLLLLAIFWNSRAIKKEKNISILISSHFILVCSIPVFLRGLYFVYELLPNRLLADLLMYLDGLRLGFLWSYGAIFCGIGGGLLVIFIAQRTLFNPARVRKIRLRKNQCRECGEKLHRTDQAWCEACGAQQCGSCTNCGENYRLSALHCEWCGSKPTTPAA